MEEPYLSPHYYCQRARKRDFVVKSEGLSRRRKGKREYLNDLQTRNLMKQLYRYFELKVEVPRIRVGKRQTVESLINEEVLLLSKYLRNEQISWALSKYPPSFNSSSSGVLKTPVRP